MRSTPSSVSRSSNGENVRVPATLPRTPSIWLNRISAESEQMAMERYKEGNVSIVEVINAQLYHQQAQVNYIQSKLNAQMAKTDFERAIYYLRKKE